LEQLSVFFRLTLHLRGDDHDGIVTHGRSREFRMHMKNPAQTGSGCILTPSPLRLNIFRLFVIISLTQLYRYTPEIFLFSTAAFKYKYRAPSDETYYIVALSIMLRLLTVCLILSYG
jgi:hypothetical protein